MNDARLRVVVCDNDEDRARGWCESIAELAPEAMSVEALPPAEFARALTALNQRVLGAKRGESFGGDDAIRFDEADVLVIDSDLTPDPDEELDDASVEDVLVGEVGDTVVRLARAHSRVGAIVMVNEAVKLRTFDLTLRRWSDGPADVYITESDVGNPGLWGFGQPADGYRPWSWPALKNLSRSLPSVTHGWTLKTRVFEALGLPEEDVARLSGQQIESLVDDVDDVNEITFADVVHSRTYGLGRQPKEDEELTQQLRTAFWGVRRWFERVVVAPQDVIIDLPHLLQERPSLMTARGDLTSLNRAALDWWNGTESALLPEAQNSLASQLLARPLWNVSALPRVERGEGPTANDPVFCEDTSRFASPADASNFDSDLPGVFDSRWVERVQDAAYIPRRRLF
ncbi:hypothetical protein [Curtobacterium sp. VKM Ac-1376]|uniref:hypothetical protein n=1 Tax=Curtobacterium sp. VKM Ac-1376 TaxID=123312 RepID=UPI001889E9D4|nr:hypothetical protein [Curtobacterium sp. VKM Ac-1376]MBF4615469.1 hypothetical protein [Curtobacterium sp. VKM Ac-1376]